MCVAAFSSAYRPCLTHGACADFLSKNEDAAAMAAVAADKAAEQAKSQIVAKSKMSKAEKSQQKKEKVRLLAQTVRSQLGEPDTPRFRTQAKAFNTAAAAKAKK